MRVVPAQFDWPRVGRQVADLCMALAVLMLIGFAAVTVFNVLRGWTPATATGPEIARTPMEASP